MSSSQIQIARPQAQTEAFGGHGQTRRRLRHVPAPNHPSLSSKALKADCCHLAKAESEHGSIPSSSGTSLPFQAHGARHKMKVRFDMSLTPRISVGVTCRQEDGETAWEPITHLKQATTPPLAQEHPLPQNRTGLLRGAPRRRSFVLKQGFPISPVNDIRR